jgi:hypothetical protein
MTFKRARSHSTFRLAGIAVCLCVFALTSSARAVQPGDLETNFDIDDANPAKSIPTQPQRDANPLEFGYYVQNMVVRAESAFEKRDWGNAVKYYEALARIVPDRAVSFSRLCTAYAGLGKVDIAAANCGKALQLGGALVYDHLQFINISLSKKALSAQDIGDIQASLDHLREHVAKLAPPQTAGASASATAGASTSATPTPRVPPSDGERSANDVKAEFLARMKGAPPAPSASTTAGPETVKPTLSLPVAIQVLDCKFAVRLRDPERLGSCVRALHDMKVDDRLVVPFEWSRALIAKNATGAAAALTHARTLAIPAPAIEAMLKEQDSVFAEKTPNRRLPVTIVAVLACAALAFALWWATLGARRRKLEAAGRV